MKLDDKCSKYFTWREVLWLPQWGIHAFPDDQIIRNIQRTTRLLDEVREHFDRPIIIHCLWRPRAYNQLVGGAKQSWHLSALAVDFHIEKIPCFEAKLELEKMLDELGCRLEDNGDNSDWVHLDLGTVGTGGRFFKP